MDSNDTRDAELAARLKRLDAGAGAAAPGFDYAGLLERHAAGIARSRRRLVLARGAAVALVVALVGASVWRLDQRGVDPVERVAAAVSGAGARAATAHRARRHLPRRGGARGSHRQRR